MAARPTDGSMSERKSLDSLRLRLVGTVIKTHVSVRQRGRGQELPPSTRRRTLRRGYRGVCATRHTSPPVRAAGPSQAINALTLREKFSWDFDRSKS